MNTPQKALEQALRSNPQFAEIMELVNASSPEEAFRTKAKQMGIDADEFINQLQQFVG